MLYTGKCTESQAADTAAFFKVCLTTSKAGFGKNADCPLLHKKILVNNSKFLILFLFISIYPADSQESDGGANT